jgi:nitrilase
MDKAIVAAVQAAPEFLDLDGTVRKACDRVADPAANGARLVAFPEAFVAGYPDWVWRTPAWHDGEFVRRLYASAVRVPSAATERLGAAAADAGAYLAIGVNEIDGGTLYNTLLYFAPDGTLAGRHRKLMPTGGERAVWGMGDGSMLGVVRTPFGVVGGLICWENYMPLARAAMYAQGVDVYLAPTWDNSDAWVATLQHIAREGRCYVLGIAPLLHGGHVPPDLRGDLYQADGDWMSRGHTAIVGPDGQLLAGPVTEREEILYAEIDPAAVQAARREFDPVGHYARPDVFRLSVDTTARQSVDFRAG